MLVVAPRRILRTLVLCSVVLVLASLATKSLHWEISRFKLGYLTTLLDTDGEQNLPTWFSSALLLGCSLLFAFVTAVRRREGRSDARHWGGLALIFALLSLDEQALIHEQFNRLRGLLDTDGALYFAWVIPAIGGLLLFGAVYLRFWLRLPPATRLLFAFAGSVYVGGALGMEMLGALLYQDDRDSMLYLLTAALEELGEMLGLSILVYALLTYIRDQLPAAGIVFAPPASVVEAATTATARC